MKTALLMIIATLGLSGISSTSLAGRDALIFHAQPAHLIKVLDPTARMALRQERRYYRRGVVISQLPAEAIKVSYQGSHYYYVDGEYFAVVKSGYRVIAPPAGIRIAVLPRDYSLAIRNGRHYYLANDVFYKPVNQNGTIYYVTVDL